MRRATALRLTEFCRADCCDDGGSGGGDVSCHHPHDLWAGRR